MAEWIALGALAGLSVYDLKQKRVNVAVVAFLALAVLVYRFCTGTGVLMLLAGLVPGAVLVLVAFATKESIGTGDGLVLCVLGMFCGLKQALAVLGTALVLAALLAMILLVLKRAGRKTELPFLPCLCAGYMLGLFW